MASVSKRPWKGPNGEMKSAWIVRYKDRGGIYRQRTFDRKKDADACRVKIEGELAVGEHLAKGQSRQVKHVAEHYLRDVRDAVKRGVLRRTTESNYVGVVERWIIPAFGEQLVNEIDTPQVEQWLRDIRRGGKLCPSAVKDRLQRLGAVIDVAIRNKWARVNPVTSVRRELRSAPRRHITTFQLEQIRALLRAANIRQPNRRRQSHMMIQCFVTLAGFCGLRWGEIAGLQAKHLDLDAGILEVRHTLNRWGDLQPPKTAAGVRDIRLPSNVAALLAAWLALYPAADGEALVFRGYDDKPVNSSSFRTNGWVPLLKQAGLYEHADPLHFHALRHFAGSWMIENGWPLPDVSEALGHANVNITLMVYAHSIKKRSNSLEAVDAIAGSLLGTAPMPLLAAPAMTKARPSAAHI